MNAELKAKWIAALRSGEFKQTRKCLKNDHGYCCLGVLAVIAGQKIGVDVGQGSGGYAWFGRNLDGFNYSTLARLNDDDRKSFPEIADYIESHL